MQPVEERVKKTWEDWPRRNQQAVALQLRENEIPIPGYRLVSELGRGGWGEVWRAHREADGADVALKFLPSESQDAAVSELRALQSIRQLDHVNLIQVHQVWSCPGYLVISMEMADGSLVDLLDIYFHEFNAPLFPEHAIFFFRQAATAIDFLNTRQHMLNGRRVAFRHCDVKPSNILVHGKVVKLADFSLAVPTSATRVNHIRAGTPTYAAPEVFQGWLSDRTDQFALAVSYCLIRGGRVPFQNVPRDFTTSYVHPEPDLSMLTPAEQPIVRRALNVVPQDRWASCVEMVDLLAEALELPPAAKSTWNPAST